MRRIQREGEIKERQTDYKIYRYTHTHTYRQGTEKGKERELTDTYTHLHTKWREGGKDKHGYTHTHGRERTPSDLPKVFHPPSEPVRGEGGERRGELTLHDSVAGDLTRQGKINTRRNQRLYQ